MSATDNQPFSAPGPKSPEGKARSSQNARTHGLTARQGETAEARKLADLWTEQIGPAQGAEEALIRSAAAAFTRAERCRQADDDARADSAATAVDRWRAKRRHAIRKMVQDLKKDPANVVADLREESFGCEWLIRQWRRLDGVLAQGVPWTYYDMIHAMQLLGFRPQAPGPDGDPYAILLWDLANAGAGSRRREAAQEIPSDPVTARAFLRRCLVEEVNRLEERRQELWESREVHRLAAVAAAAKVDTTKEGQLRQRYGKEATAEMVRCLNSLMRMQSERAKLDAREQRRVQSEGAADGPAAAANEVASTVAQSPPSDSRNESSADAGSGANGRRNSKKDHNNRRASSIASDDRDPRTDGLFAPVGDRPEPAPTSRFVAESAADGVRVA